MELIPVLCPCCKGQLKIPNDANKFFCNHCGTQIIASNSDLKNIKVEGIVQTRSADFDIQGGVLKGYHGESVHVVIPEGVKKIDAKCFEGMMIESVIVPDGVTIFESSVFQWCSNLKKVILPRTMADIGWNTFSGCKELREVEMPDGIKSIPHYAFHGCESLIKIIIPSSCKTIGDSAFAGCSSLKEVEWKGCCDAIKQHVFRDCFSLEEITIPEGVKELEEGLFQDCKNLKYVHLPKTLERIGMRTFCGCQKLERIEVPEGVEWISHGTFANPLKEISLPASLNDLVWYAFCVNHDADDFLSNNAFETLEVIHLKSNKHINDCLLKMKKLKMVYCNNVPVDWSYIAKFCGKDFCSTILSDRYEVYSPWREYLIKQEQEIQKRMQRRHCPKCDISLKSVKLFDKSEMYCPKCNTKVSYK